MSPIRVPSERRAQIGENGVEHKRTESGGGDGPGEVRQLGAARGSGVAGAGKRSGCGRGIAGRGGKALQHRNCGRRSNRAYPGEFRCRVLNRVQERYADFGATLASEHLASDDGLEIPAESLRRWMREAGLWSRRRKRKPYRPRRERKAHFGELVQLDGSFHRWLEERADHACLMHMIDDASNTVHAQFSAQETIWAAVHLLRGWIERHGIPRALYTDWKNVYEGVFKRELPYQDIRRTIPVASHTVFRR